MVIIRMKFSGCTSSKVYDLIEQQLEKGKNIACIAHHFTPQQLGNFIDEYFEAKPVKQTSTVDRSISKGLCCFLFELQKKHEPCHYSEIRDLTKLNYGHMTNDYSTLKYFDLIQKSNAGNGYWSLTNLGLAFLQGVVNVPSFVTVKNNVVISRSNQLVNISDFENFNAISYDGEPITYNGQLTDIA